MASPTQSPRPRCAWPKCRRRAVADDNFCAAHALMRGVHNEPEPAGTERDPGSYRILLDNDLRTTLARATAEIMNDGLIDELGALRIVLLRVLVEETEISKLVTNITRIVTVAAQAMRVQHAVSGEGTTAMLESINAMLKGVLEPPPSAKEEETERTP